MAHRGHHEIVRLLHLMLVVAEAPIQGLADLSSASSGVLGSTASIATLVGSTLDEVNSA